MNWNLRPTRAALVMGMLSLLAAEAAAVDVEPNDSLATAQPLVGNASGETLVAGEFGPVNVDPGGVVSSLHTLVQGQVNAHDFTGLAAGAAALVFLDNDLGFVAPDTVMRALDEFGNETAQDDDGSPLGDGRASGLFTLVNADGTLHLEVTGFADFDFDGIDDDAGVAHGEFGNYELSYLLGPFGDVDFFRITGLQPGTKWTVETLAAPGEEPIDTILTQYDGSGRLLSQNDDIDPGADNFLSALIGTVPAGGEIIVAVTAFPDAMNVGAHVTEGPYTLRWSYTAIPEPGGAMLILLGALIAPMARAARRGPSYAVT